MSVLMSTRLACELRKSPRGNWLIDDGRERDGDRDESTTDSVFGPEEAGGCCCSSGIAAGPGQASGPNIDGRPPDDTSDLVDLLLCHLRALLLSFAAAGEEGGCWVSAPACPASFSLSVAGVK
jgi:hypothetical protein